LLYRFRKVFGPFPSTGLPASASSPSLRDVCEGNSNERNVIKKSYTRFSFVPTNDDPEENEN